MNINRNSWHYKIVRDKYIFEENMPSTLCKYFWVLVWQLVKLFLMGVFFLAVGIMSVWVIISPFVWWYLGFPTSPEPKSLENFVIMGVAFLVAIMFIVILVISVKLIFAIGGVLSTIPRVSSNKQKEPNILKEYLKAKKEKVCPMVSYKEKDNE